MHNFNKSLEHNKLDKLEALVEINKLEKKLINKSKMKNMPKIESYVKTLEPWEILRSKLLTERIKKLIIVSFEKIYS